MAKPNEAYCEAAISLLAGAALKPQRVTLYDARTCAPAPTYQNDGFELIELPSAVASWSDLAAVEAVHYDEVAVWAKAFSGCDAVAFYPALLRSPEAARLSEDPSTTVCLLEAGGKGDGLLVRMPAGAVAMLPGWGSIKNWAYETVPQAELNGRRGYQPRRRTLG